MATELETVRAVFDAFARRDRERLSELITDDMEFHAVTAEVAGREGPYRGREGMDQYFDDVEATWDEIVLTPVNFEQVGDVVLVTGRVWASGSGRVVDSSTGWLFDAPRGAARVGRVFESAAEAKAAAEAR